MADADAAVAIVHARAVADSVLLIRRAERDSDSWSGHWSFPGGRREPADRGLLHTALRELEEECGIRLESEKLVRVLAPAVARRRVGRYLLVLPFLFRVNEELTPVPDPQEAADAIWVPLDVLRDPGHHVLRPVPGLPAAVRFPAIDLKGVPLWGFTYRLIADWLDLNPRDRSVQDAGFQAACALLNTLLAHGCSLKQDWVERDGANVATVAGRVPPESVLAQAWSPAAHIPWLNMLEVRPDRVRIVGLAFEEYLIEVAP